MFLRFPDFTKGSRNGKGLDILFNERGSSLEEHMTSLAVNGLIATRRDVFKTLLTLLSAKPQKMVEFPNNCLCVFHHLVRLTLKGLMTLHM